MVFVLSDGMDENRHRFGVSRSERPSVDVVRRVGVLGDSRNAAVRAVDMAVVQQVHRSLDSKIASAEARWHGREW